MPLSPTYPVRSDRLSLRPLEPGDLEALLDYHSSAEVHRFLPMREMDAETILTRIREGPWSRSRLEEAGQAVVLGITVADDPTVVGDAMLLWTSESDRSGEVGYVLNPRHSGRGYATEAVGALLGLAFGDFGLHRVVARIDARNEPSIRVALRLGMREEGRFVESVWNHGEWVDLVTFALLDREWAAGTVGVV